MLLLHAWGKGKAGILHSLSRDGFSAFQSSILISTGLEDSVKLTSWEISLLLESSCPLYRIEDLLVSRCKCGSDRTLKKSAGYKEHINVIYNILTHPTKHKVKYMLFV
jgi:hypothetical protein